MTETLGSLKAFEATAFQRFVKRLVKRINVSKSNHGLRFTHFFLRDENMSPKKDIERSRGGNRKAILVLMILLIIIITILVESCGYCKTWLKTLLDILEILKALITLWRDLKNIV